MSDRKNKGGSRIIEDYYRLVKPGIVRGNTMTAAAGFLFGDGKTISFAGLAALTVGIALVIASACVINNYLDRQIDAKMERTKQRALVSGKISARQALIFALALGIGGFAALIIFNNLLSAAAAAFGFVVYISAYTFSKRITHHGTLIGSLSGGAPPVAGYLAASGRFDLTAVLLFLILAAWQMPHFYTIALFRSKEYLSADIPVLPLSKGISRTKAEIMIYSFIFILAIVSLFVFSYAGYIYMAVMMAVSLYWFWLSLGGRKLTKQDDIVRWAKKMFGTSLLVLLVFSVMISANSFLP